RTAHQVRSCYQSDHGQSVRHRNPGSGHCHRAERCPLLGVKRTFAKVTNSNSLCSNGNIGHWSNMRAVGFRLISTFKLWCTTSTGSASFARSASLIVSVVLGFVGDVRTALHVINERSQLRHYLPVARIVEKHTRRHRRERPQHAYEFSCCQDARGDRLRHLRKTHTFDGRPKQSRKVVSNQRPRYGNLDRAAVVVERP